MSDTTGIEWCDKTWSPWEGCQKVSPACDFCYAEARNNRFSAGRNWGPGAPRRKTADWTKPRLWNRKAAKDGARPTVFPSICDPFDNAVPDEWREEFFELIRVTPHLTWLLLTKRPQNIIRMVRKSGAIAGNGTLYLPDNVRLGTTAEDQERANLNLPHLMTTKDELGARGLFVSVEPMLGAVDLTRVIHPTIRQCDAIDPFVAYDVLRGHMIGPDDVGLAKLDWVIAGGESGSHARPSHPDWFRSLRDQCAAAGVPFLFKQNGEFVPMEVIPSNGVAYAGTWTRLDGTQPALHELASDPPSTECLFRVGKKTAGRLLDGVEHNGFPPRSLA